jgi:tRNA nucleotidyltransferase (CCA-adding enzyme)
MDRYGQISDFVGGQSDLTNKIIRCVGEPDLRIREDALRILRALRFSSILGFPIDEKTKSSLFANKDLLLHISAERIWSELSGILCGKSAAEILLDYSTILGIFIPEILPMIGFLQYNPHHMYDVWVHTVQVVANTPPIRTIRLAALLHDSGKPYTFVKDGAGVGHFYGHQKISRDIAHTVLLRLKADTRTRERVETLVLWHDIAIEPSEKNIRRRLHQFGEDVLRDLLTLKRADTLGQSDKSRYRLEEQAHIQILLEKILADNACFSMKNLAIGGKDLLAAGMEPGAKIGAALTLALNAVIDGEIPNDHDALLEFVRRNREMHAT